MEKTENRLENFMCIIENDHPKIKPFITEKRESSIEVHIPFDHNKTWDSNWSEIDSILSISKSSKMLIKKSSITFNEKYDFFKIILDFL